MLWGLAKELLMGTHNICLHGYIRKISILFGCKKVLSKAIVQSFNNYIYKSSQCESQCQKTYLQTCAPSEDSYQLEHSHCPIRIFTQGILHSQGCKISSYGQRRVKSNSMDAQADFSP